MTEATLTIRRARRDDLDAINIVEAGSTPGLRYVARVFDDFVSDEIGEFSVAEIDGQVVACGKFTLMPDHSAWLETLRVQPAYQGRGAGKRLYERFFEVARRAGVTTLRMYTGVTNLVSKGLAERFGFRLAGTFRGAWLPLEAAAAGPAPAFMPVSDPERAAALLMPHAPRWTGFVVMNRTFYALSPILCADVDDVDAIYATLSAKGVPFTRPPLTQPWGYRVAYFNDPEGNLWELRQSV